MYYDFDEMTGERFYVAERDDEVLLFDMKNDDKYNIYEMGKALVEIIRQYPQVAEALYQTVYKDSDGVAELLYKDSEYIYFEGYQAGAPYDVVIEISSGKIVSTRNAEEEY